MINKSSEIKYIIIQGILTLCIAFIPIYFYIDATLENQNIKDKMKLKNYTASVVAKMDAVFFENSDIFYYPRSNIFTSAIYDQENKVIFSLFSKEPTIDFHSEFYQDNEKICYKHYLHNNVFKAKHIISCKNINSSQVIYNVIILLLTLSSLIFLSSFIMIKQSIEPYKKLNKYLDDFLKDAMHELKTPIGVARANVDMLEIQFKKNKHLIRIKSALKNMSVVYEDLEYYMQRHSVKDSKQTIDFSSFLQQRIDFFRDLAIAKRIKFRIDIEKEISLNFNEIALYRIIDNNISNAIKYSKNDSLIQIELYKQQNNIILRFKDNGIGIKETEKIFHRYYRGDKISGGFGIGLSIVKRICDKNNIKIDLISIPDKGSIFTYTFVQNS